MVADNPRYEHDCAKCVFLGTVERTSRGNSAEVFDLYFCDGFIPTIIARYGDDGCEYMSGMCFGYHEELPLWDARERAMERGLVSIKACRELRSAFENWKARKKNEGEL